MLVILPELNICLLMNGRMGINGADFTICPRQFTCKLSFLELQV